MEFIINNQKWKIVELNQEDIRTEMKKRNDHMEEYGKYYGLTCADTQNIFIDKDLCQDRKRNTLLHELGHCYIITYITHLDKKYNEEDVADIISNSHDIIRNVVDKYFKEV